MVLLEIKLNALRANPTKWSNTLKQFFGNSRTRKIMFLWGWIPWYWTSIMEDRIQDSLNNFITQLIFVILSIHYFWSTLGMPLVCLTVHIWNAWMKLLLMSKHMQKINFVSHLIELLHKIVWINLWLLYKKTNLYLKSFLIFCWFITLKYLGHVWTCLTTLI